ncbi:hut operon transcriptional regulator HutP [Robertmurraya kyonggiensis]|uniref:Hut operon positive regulatory protein n=1 Tax=Robertmurraya kyonggiensis TaxID=1037680 RepID=A0A4U1DD63_9BACI|nr:hut operon transcriptional regulator HutP [Robertmurraya kyonggiensis]TKC19527.1 hut operon transcriptional regulator HutP [Robertmurraya kyonggiensis]
MTLKKEHRIGRHATLLLLMEETHELEEITKQLNWKSCLGKVGSMDSQKVVAAIEVAAKQQGIIKENLYRESHALYHAIMEALHGITRGQMQLGSVMRTVGLRFAVVRGNPYEEEVEGEWLAVAIYGTIGAPVRGLEHETLGLGINHI